MKTFFKFMLLLSMLIITSVTLQASEKQTISPPECTVLSSQSLGIEINTISSVLPVKPDFIYTYYSQTVEMHKLKLSDLCTFSTDTRYLVLSKNILYSENLISNLLPKPFVRCINSKNSINHYSTAKAYNPTNTIRSV